MVINAVFKLLKIVGKKKSERQLHRRENIQFYVATVSNNGVATPNRMI